MEVNAVNVKFFVGSSSTEKGMRKKNKFGELSTKNYGQCCPSNNEKAIKFGMRKFTER